MLERVGSNDSGGHFREGECFVATPDLLKKSECLPKADGRKQYLLLGNSIGAELYAGLSHEFPEVQFWQATKWICPPLQDASIMATIDEDWERCKANSDYWYGDLLTNHHPDRVLLAGIWTPAMLPELGKTLQWLKSHKFNVTLFGPPIEFNASVSKLIFTGLRSGRMDMLDQHWMERAQELNATMRLKAATEWHVEYISEFDDLCREDIIAATQRPSARTHGCPMMVGPGVPMKSDGSHLTDAWVALFAQQMRARHELP